MKTTMQRIGMILFMTGFIFAAAAQLMEVRGTVYDDKKQPIIGANIFEKETTTNGTVSDWDGKFYIKTEKGKTLVFSYVGYKTQEIKIKDVRMDVYLNTDEEGLEKLNAITTGPLIIKEGTVLGFVYDATNKSVIIGATVRVMETGVGAVSDRNGYSLKAKKGETLEFSYLGYQTQKITVKNTKFDVYLEPDISLPEEIIVKTNSLTSNKNNFPTHKQQMEVSGTVYDNQKQPIIGVTILQKGANRGTVSDVNGKYRIKTEKGKTLVFSYIGYKTQEVKVKDSQLDVYLKPDMEVLEEVVIVGFGTQKRSTVVGSATAVVGHSYSRPPIIFPYPVDVNTEEYEAFKENRFLSVVKNPLSTFSLDVDAASYGNIRRMINQGQMPQKDAVRVEEMINYFSYNYPQPTGEHPVNIVAETAVCPWNKKHSIVRIGVKAKEIPSERLPASNFVFLIDVSGSMYGADKLPLVKSSMKLLLNNLRPKDRVAIVTYAGAAGEALPSTSASDKQKIMDALENLQAGGSTAGGAGIELAYKIAEKNFVKGGNNRVILCTDGDFNVGVSSNEGLESLIETKRKSGIFLTVLGYGMGNYKDKQLQTLAQKGNGNHAYIDNLQEANKVLVNEFGSTMYAVAKDVKLQVEFNPAFVNAYRLIGYETRLLNDEDFNDDTKDAGELGAGHTVTALYEIVPVGVDAPVGIVDKLKYQQTKTDISAPKLTNSNELLTVKLRYKKPNEDVSKKLEVPVLANKVNVNVSADFNFAMAVAMFGQLLRDSDFKGDATYSNVINLARKGLGDDPNGYRREFIRLVEAVEQLSK